MVRKLPELNSVGHVNQSALYLAFALFPLILLLTHYDHVADYLICALASAAVFYFQGPARSMVGFGACLIVIGGMWIFYCWERRYLKLFFGSLVFGFATLSFLVTQPPQSFGLYWFFEGVKRPFESYK